MINFMETTFSGGINKTVSELSKNLSKKGHKVTVIQPNPHNLQNIDFCNGFKIIRINSKIEKYLYSLNPEMWIYLKKNLSNLNPNIIHIHGYLTLLSPQVTYLLKKMNLKIPVIISPHFAPLSHNTLVGRHFGKLYDGIIGKRFLKDSNRIVVASEFECNNVNRILDVPKDKIRIISHGVSKIEEKKHKAKTNKINLLYVGYLFKLKGVQFIIEAVDELIKNNCNIVLNIVGEGPYENVLREMVKKLNLDDYVIWNKFIPPKDNEKLLNYYKSADILLLLSESENYGAVVIEALAMGTPVIVAKNTSLIEFLDEEGCFGVDFPPDSKKVSNLIRKVYENGVKVGPYCKIKTWNKVTDDYERLYNDVLNEKVVNNE